MCEIRLSQLNFLCCCRCDTWRRWSRHAAIRQRKPIKINREATKASGISERTERAEVIHARNVVREVNLRETSTSWAVFEVVRRRKERRCWVFVSGSLSRNRIGWKLSQLSVFRLMTRGKRITLMEYNRLRCYPVCPALASPATDWFNLCRFPFRKSRLLLGSGRSTFAAFSKST